MSGCLWEISNCTEREKVQKTQIHHEFSFHTNDSEEADVELRVSSWEEAEEEEEAVITDLLNKI